MINMNEGTIHDLMRDIVEYERQEARQERDLEIANNLINEGIPIKQIAKATKLDINTIKQLNIGK